MAWAVPQFGADKVNEAGRKLASMEFPILAPAAKEMLEVINNWRAAHAYPLNTFQTTLRRNAKKIETEVIVAQRIKRLESIHRKLTSNSSMRLTQMQDIAGCRVVLKDINSIGQILNLYSTSRFGHKLRSEKDYILEPKKDGYRSHHLVYQYKGTNKTTAYTDLRIEIQIRTQLQHAWATAVEAVGLFTRQALKSNQGSQDWLRFFSLMGSAIAAIENCNPVPGTPTDKSELISEITQLSEKLRVPQFLQVYNATITNIGSATDAKYFLIELNIDENKIIIRSYKAMSSELANVDYTRIESEQKEGSLNQIVLVSVENVNALKRAYPNYFLDTANFSKLVKRVLAGNFPDPRPHNVSVDAS
jgi:hypothetical protein